MGDFAVDDLTAYLCDLEPIEMPKGLRRSSDPVTYGGIDVFGRGTDNLGYTICPVCHGASSRSKGIQRNVASVRVISRGQRKTTVYHVTDALRPMSEDIRYRQRRYLISMGIRTACLLTAIFLAGRGPVWLIGIMIAAAVILPYVSVVFANGGREPENTPRLETPSEPPAGRVTPAPPVDADTQRTSRKQISGHHRQIGS
jgi:hypothetical protein